MMRKAQTATEFVVLISFMILIFFVFFTVIQQKVVTAVHAQDVQYLKEANNIVLSEIQLARQVHADYQRNFSISTLSDKPFTVQLTDPFEITTRFNDIEYVNFLSTPVNGTIVVGTNTIYKLDGRVLFENGTLRSIDSYSGIFLNVNPEACYIADKTGTCSSLSYEADCRTYFNLCNLVCGDSIIDVGEDCDPPEAPCTPSYDSSCSFCNSACQYETLNGAYCGDGTCDNSHEHFGTCPNDCLPTDVDVEGYISTIELESGIYSSIFQPNGTYGEDAYVDDYGTHATTNYGMHDRLHAANWGSWGARRSYLYFDLSFLSFPEAILQANISLYWHNASGCNTVNAWCYNGRSYSMYYENADMFVQRVTEAWDEFTITWNDQPTSTLTNQVSVPAPTSMVANHTDIDITILAQDLLATSNYGFLIKVQSESPYRSVNFASSDNIYPLLRPKFVLQYTLCGDGHCAGNENLALCPADCS